MRNGRNGQNGARLFSHNGVYCTRTSCLSKQAGLGTPQERLPQACLGNSVVFTVCWLLCLFWLYCCASETSVTWFADVQVLGFGMLGGGFGKVVQRQLRPHWGQSSHSQSWNRWGSDPFDWTICSSYTRNDPGGECICNDTAPVYWQGTNSLVRCFGLLGGWHRSAHSLYWSPPDHGASNVQCAQETDFEQSKPGLLVHPNTLPLKEVPWKVVACAGVGCLHDVRVGRNQDGFLLLSIWFWSWSFWKPEWRRSDFSLVIIKWNF